MSWRARRALAQLQQASHGEPLGAPGPRPRGGLVLGGTWEGPGARAAPGTGLRPPVEELYRGLSQSIRGAKILLNVLIVPTW